MPDTHNDSRFRSRAIRPGRHAIEAGGRTKAKNTGDAVFGRACRLLAAVALSGLLVPAPALARETAAGRRLSPAQVIGIPALQGFRDPGSPRRRGEVFLVDATAHDGVRHTLVVTARTGLLVGAGPAIAAE